jgi:lipopolysaccharide transport system ATP-binding protein
MSKPIIEVENLGKCYHLGQLGAGSLRDEIEQLLGRRKHGPAGAPKKGDFWALQDVSFSVQEGEVLGIIGRNGAGKSTLLKLLSRITEPTTGRAILRGRVASLLEVGTGFHPELSGRENIFLNGAVLGMTRAEVARKFDEIVDFAGVEMFLDTPVKRYSSGMYVRLAFAVAAHLEPEILIVDEVLAVGDATFQAKCIGRMSEVSQEGRTVLFVSHQMPMIQRLCSRSVWIDGGRVAGNGPTSDVLSCYLTQINAQEESAQIDLCSVKRENPAYRGLRQIEMENGEGRRTVRMQMGDVFRIKVFFERQSLMRDIELGVGIEDSGGQRLITLSNYFSREVGEVSGRRGVFTFTVPNLRLLPGKYWLTFYLLADRRTCLDRCNRCFSFWVDPRDVFGTGHIPANHQGVTYAQPEVDVVVHT